MASGKDEGTIGPRIKELGVPVHALRLNSTIPNPLRAFTLRSLVREFKPQIIQGWMYHGNMLASVAARLTSEPAALLWNIRQSVADVAAYGRKTAAVIRLGARLSRRPRAIIYNTMTGAQQHEALGYDASKRVVIPNGFDCAVFHPDEAARREVRTELGIPPDTVLVGLIARYHPMKNHLGFLTAAADVARAHPAVCFVLAGTGVSKENPDIATFVAQRQLQTRVFLLGERHDTAHLTASLDIACSASAWGEGFSNAIGEAMACGVPCVVTGVGDSPYIIGDTGITVSPGNPAELANAITRLIEAGAERRRQLGEAARQRVEREFSLPSVACRYEELYQKSLLREPAQRGFEQVQG